jgi:predicted enzyme related to lactoylglutathione lyase
MSGNVRYVHTNIISKDWRKLASFYIEVFGCKPIYPERDLSGEWLEKFTGIKDAKIKGIHLSLPGFDKEPTLEIFEYTPESLRSSEPQTNNQGLGHLAFHADDVEEIVTKLIEHGGHLIGEVVKKEYPGIGLLTAAYTKDPEGNIIEIQNWKK